MTRRSSTVAAVRHRDWTGGGIWRRWPGGIFNPQVSWILGHFTWPHQEVPKRSQNAWARIVGITVR
eukprot:719866-Amphidinium_carterae.3